MNTFLPLSGTGTPSPCVITDGANTYSSLQAANDAATSGDSLSVQGTCTAPTTLLSKDLNIVGVGTAPTMQSHGRSRPRPTARLRRRRLAELRRGSRNARHAPLRHLATHPRAAARKPRRSSKRRTSSSG